MIRYRQVFLSILGILAMMACKKKPEFSDIPQITYLSLTKTVGYKDEGVSSNGSPQIVKIDSAVISIYFKDGDGDLGTSETKKNYMCKVFMKNDNVFSELVDFKTKAPIDKNGTFASLNPDGRQGPIEGTLNYGPSLNFTGVIDPDSLKYDFPYTFKFQVYIIDNAGHASNIVETDTVQIQYYSQ
jgi:hypothetical protein